jgi:hypothetical protein
VTLEWPDPPADLAQIPAGLAAAARSARNVVALSWGHCLGWLREAWPPGAHGALIGPTGEGKTTVAVGMLKQRKWVLALDPKGEDDTLSASGYTRIETWPLERTREGRQIREDIAAGLPARLIVGGAARTREEYDRLGQLMRSAVEGVRAEGGWTVYADEFQLLADRRMFAIDKEIEQLLIAARTRGTSVLTSFQAPAWVPKAGTRQASLAVIWGTRDRGMLKTVAEAMGRPWRDLEAMVDELPEYHVLMIPKRIREPLILTRAPKVG